MNSTTISRILSVSNNTTSVVDAQGGVTTTTTQTIRTLETSRFDNGIVDISIIPFMRDRLIRFTATGMRPNRRVYFFFDDVDITDHIVRADDIELTQNSNVAIFNTLFNRRERLLNGSNSASVLAISRRFDSDDTGVDIPRRRILRVADVVGEIGNSVTFTSTTTGNSATISSYTVFGDDRIGSYFTSLSANSIVLSPKSRTVANNYWGTDASNTITLIARTVNGARPAKGYITGFDNVSRRLTLSNTLNDIISTYPASGLPISNNVENTRYSWMISPASSSVLRTDAEGTISGTFVLPAGVFRTGERIFRIIDDFNNDPADATTRAEYKFNSSGLTATRQDTVVNSIKEETRVIAQTFTPPPPPQPERRGGGGGGGGGGNQSGPGSNPPSNGTSRDPIAQTFFVTPEEFPNGMFLSSVGIYFSQKDNIIPVEVQIRPTVNGYPDSVRILPGGRKVISADLVNANENSLVETRFTFDSPVYLEPGEYAVVVYSDSLEYEAYVAEIGSKLLGTNSRVTRQPYLGSFFKSQNASTWDAIQMEDLCLKLYRCEFASSGQVTFHSSNTTQEFVNADGLITHLTTRTLPNTNIATVHSTNSGVSFREYEIDSEEIQTARVQFSNTNSGIYRVTATLTTGDTRVTPSIVTDSAITVALENFIDNANILARDINIVSTGSGYSANANVVLNIASSTGSGAQAFALANSTGHITQVIVPNGGSGYFGTITATPATGSATFAVTTELDSSGGPALSKYISRTVTLNEGFEATDLKVFLTAYKPLGTDVKVYYKIRNANDPQPFDDEGYTLMTQTTSAGTYSARETFRNGALEYEFIPPTVPITYASGNVTYNSFSQYSIKIVLLSDSTLSVPIVYDVRAIALP